MGLLDIQKITKEFRSKLVLDSVSLQIEKRERVALIGDNGSGKSTLIRIAMGLETPDLGQVTFARGIKVGYLSQASDELIEGEHNALYYEKVHKLESQLRDLELALKQSASQHDTPEYHLLTQQYARVLSAFEAMDGYTVHHNIKKILLGLGLKQEALEIPLSKLSGGEKMRVALARILLENPDLLILDEPTNHLDLGAIEWLENYLVKFPGGVLIVSHDRYFLDRVGTRIAHLSRGGLIEKRCRYSQYIEQQQIERTFYLKEQKNLGIQIRDANEQIQNLKRMRKNKQADSRIKEVERLKETYQANQRHAQVEGAANKPSGPQIQLSSHGHVAKEIAWASGLGKVFNGVTLFQDVDFTIYGGERVALIGANGCGKTTLLNILRGLDNNFTGKAVLGSWATYAYLGQHIDFEDDSRSMLQEIMMTSTLDEPQSRQHLGRFQFYGDEVNSTISVLSGGEKVRLFLAKVMLTHPHVLILDEPTNHLDLASREALELAINAFKGTVIAVSHDRYYLKNCVDKLIAFKDGTAKVYDGNYDVYLEQVSGGGASGSGSGEDDGHQGTSTMEPVQTRTAKNKAKAKAREESKAKIKPVPKRTVAQLEAAIEAVEEEIKELEIEIGFEGKDSDYEALAERYQYLEALYEDYDASE